MDQIITSPRKRGRPRMSEEISPAKIHSSKSQPEANSLGARIRLSRKQLGMGQAELAQPEYVTSYISAIERNKIRPSLKALKLLAGRLGKPVEYLLYGGDSTPVKDSAGRGITLKLVKAQVLVEIYELDGGSPEYLEDIASIISELPYFELTEYERVGHTAIQGWLKEQQGDNDVAEQDYLNALKLAQKTGQIEAQIELKNRLGYLTYHRGQIEQAVELYREALLLCENNRDLIPDTVWLDVFGRLGRGLLGMGRTQEALDCHAEIISWQERTANPTNSYENYRNLARVYREHQDLRMATRYQSATLASVRKLQHSRLKTESQARFGEWLVDMGRAAEAQAMLEDALKATQKGITLGKPVLALIYGNLARLRLNEGRAEEAFTLVEQALTEGQTSGDRLIEGKIYRILAEIEDNTGQVEKAKASFNRAIECLEEAKAKNEQLAEIYKAYSKALEKWGELELALKFLKKAVLLKV